MTTLYKLTRADMTTYGGCKWGEGVEYLTDGRGNLCGPGWLHAYTNPLLAVLLNPIHGSFGSDMLLWEADGDVGKENHGLKVGCTRLKTLHVIPLPEISLNQKIAFGLLCALELPQEEGFKKWAKAWLDGTDRTERARAAVWAAAEAAAAVAAPLDLPSLAKKAMQYT